VVLSYVAFVGAGEVGPRVTQSGLGTEK
jgi:hypothetical protein